MAEKTFQRYPFSPIGMFKQGAQLQVQNAQIGKTNTAFPGQNMGMDLAQVKEIIANSEKVIAVVFQSAVGEVTPEIKFPSTAKYLLGFSFSPIANVTDTFKMNINEEQSITLSSAYAYSNRGGTPDSPFFQFLRIIGGSTSVEMKYISLVGGETIVFTAHYV